MGGVIIEMNDGFAGFRRHSRISSGCVCFGSAAVLCCCRKRPFGSVLLNVGNPVLNSDVLHAASRHFVRRLAPH